MKEPCKILNFKLLRFHLFFFIFHLGDCSKPRGGEGGGNAIYVPYGDVPPIRVYFLTFESLTGCLFSNLTLKQVAKFVRLLRARVHIHSTVWHPPVGFNLFVFCP